MRGLGLDLQSSRSACSVEFLFFRAEGGRDVGVVLLHPLQHEGFQFGVAIQGFGLK